MHSASIRLSKELRGPAVRTRDLAPKMAAIEDHYETFLVQPGKSSFFSLLMVNTSLPLKFHVCLAILGFRRRAVMEEFSSRGARLCKFRLLQKETMYRMFCFCCKCVLSKASGKITF
jgi:hypothetical protein